MNKLRDKSSSNRDDITAFFRSTPGLVVGGIILVGFVVCAVLGGIFGWY